ncbi:hypothetical protein NP233_g2090 [Leucocoprinus birnbaumii]|uniref:Uncharacterized protein n=1 Tax=Leucocoprinus birnbaumii TaxID=56174 RepID=A0AAD5W4Y1_9AGAR|nr:hypothetical protein NP233_g2090 [Leucocoprinus birnbaumii]
MTDVSALEQTLRALGAQSAQQDDEQLWRQVQSTSEALANALRSQDGPVDNRTLLGRTTLPQTIKLLLTTAMKVTPIPTDVKATAVLELIRVSANFCIDDNENRSHLLEASVIQIILSLLESYNEKIQHTSPNNQLTTFELKLIRITLGALLNASLDYDEVKTRLNSLEAGQTTLRLVAQIYTPGSWISIPKGAPQAIDEEWSLRSTISSWGWRLVSELRSVGNEAVQIFSVDDLPLLTPSLSAFIPPFEPLANCFFAGSPTLATLVKSDSDVLEDACTLLESLSLDVEDIRIALARDYLFPAENSGAQCLSTILDFIELGDYPPSWNDSGVFDDSERERREKVLGMCKAALVKAIVEVAGEERNSEVLWDDSNQVQPGVQGDDLIIAATLSLGNLSRRSSSATALLSAPYSLAPVLVSPLFLSTKTDLKVKHAVLGFLKNLAQNAGFSPIISKALGGSDVVRQLRDSGIWDERSDRMADVVQLNAIGVVKHLCSVDVEHTFALTIPAQSTTTLSGLEQILALVKRTESVPVRSEGTRVLVNAIRSLWAVEPSNQPPSQERQRSREIATQLVLTQESADALASLLASSGRYPVLINESVLALTLLSMHSDGGQLVAKALSKPMPSGVAQSSVEPFATSPTSDVSSPAVASPLSARPKLHVPRHGLDMLIFVLRNVDNPANYPQEVRINVCSLLLQLTKNTSEDDLATIKEAIRSTLEKLTNRLQQATGKDELLRNNMSNITVDISEGIATIQLNRPETLNALTPEATGKWFCAGTSVRSKSPEKALESLGSLRKSLVNNVALTTLDCSKALYSHRKILVAALNGPVMALLGLFDFIYAMPNMWMSTPFTFLGIVAEGGASASFANRMGVAKANEMLIWGEKKEAQELLECGFINKIFPQQSVESFHKEIRNLLKAELEGLDQTAVLTAKKLIKAGMNDKNDFDAVNLRESYGEQPQAERFASGVPFTQFARIAKKEIRHKL